MEMPQRTAAPSPAPRSTAKDGAGLILLALPTMALALT